MTFAEAVKMLLMLGIFLTVFALALRARPSDILHLVRDWKLGLGAFAAMYVIVPLVAILIAASFDLKAPVKIAIVALAFSPVPPLLPRKQLKAGGGASYVTSLLVLASLASLAVTPLGLHFASWLFSVELEISSWAIARILGIGIALPLAAGFIGRRVLGDRTKPVAATIAKVANALFLVCVLGLLIRVAPAIWSLMGDGTAWALLAMIIAGLVAGRWLAGDLPEDKAALSLAAAARHPGVAIAIATSNFPDAKLAPAAIILFALLNALIGIPYLQRLNRENPAP